MGLLVNYTFLHRDPFHGSGGTHICAAGWNRKSRHPFQDSEPQNPGSTDPHSLRTTYLPKHSLPTPPGLAHMEVPEDLHT